MKKILLKDMVNEKIGVLCTSNEEAKLFTKRVKEELNSNDTICSDNLVGDKPLCFSLEGHANLVSWWYGSEDNFIDNGYEIVGINDIIDININSSKIVVIVGCSASGKDKTLKALTTEGFVSIVSHTSRPMRPFEVEGENYYFVSKEKAKEMLDNGEFIEHRIYHIASGEDWIYGISKEVIDKALNDSYNSVAIVDYQGMLELKRHLKSIGKLDKLVTVYINATSQTRLKRSLEREGEMDEIQVAEVVRRFIDDNEKVAPAIYDCDLSIKNEKLEDIEKAVKLIKVLVGE